MIHVAGTNGKGSTVAYLRAIAEAAGLTSPRHHLAAPGALRRAHPPGRAADHRRATSSSLIDRVEAVNAGEPISFFEITTRAGLHGLRRDPRRPLHLSRSAWAAGFDATNIFDAPGGQRDHARWTTTTWRCWALTLAKIAWEKAGIIKQGRPVVVARQMEEARRGHRARGRGCGAPC